MGKVQEVNGGWDGGRWLDDNNGGGRRRPVPAGGRRNHAQNRAKQRRGKQSHLGKGGAGVGELGGDGGIPVICLGGDRKPVSAAGGGSERREKEKRSRWRGGVYTGSR